MTTVMMTRRYQCLRIASQLLESSTSFILSSFVPEHKEKNYNVPPLGLLSLIMIDRGCLFVEYKSKRSNSPVAEGVFACMRETENFSSDFVYIHPKM